MSDDVCARAKAALEGVGPGPWEMRDGFVYPLSISARLGGIRPVDAEFIAAARSLIPELLAEVERLREVGTFDCAQHGRGRFEICSRCQFPPCAAVVGDAK